MSQAYLCVGGPLDGKEVVTVEGMKSFRVAEPPNLEKFGRYDAANVCPEPFEVKVYEYVLRRHPVNGFVWVLL